MTIGGDRWLVAGAIAVTVDPIVVMVQLVMAVLMMCKVFKRKRIPAQEH